jgi:hypothetical protein
MRAPHAALAWSPSMRAAPWALPLPLPQVASASRAPWDSYLASPPASWLDDFLSWSSPEVPQCCRRDANGTACPPPDQPPCAADPGACASCSACFAPGELPPGELPSAGQFSDLLPQFMAALPSGACAKGGAAYSGTIQVGAAAGGTEFLPGGGAGATAACASRAGACDWVASLPPHAPCTSSARSLGALACTRCRLAPAASQLDASDPTGVAGLSGGVVTASSFRASHSVLSQQADFLGALQVRAGVRALVRPSVFLLFRLALGVLPAARRLPRPRNL